MPVRTYSSGMFMRLGFSVAMHVNPDVLLLDEVLAVGDEAFQQKCFGRIWDYRRAGGTIVFVSHDADAVRAPLRPRDPAGARRDRGGGRAGGALPHVPPPAGRTRHRPCGRPSGGRARLASDRVEIIDVARLRRRRHLARAVPRGRADACSRCTCGRTERIEGTHLTIGLP